METIEVPDELEIISVDSVANLDGKAFSVDEILDSVLDSVLRIAIRDVDEVAEASLLEKGEGSTDEVMLPPVAEIALLSVVAAILRVLSVVEEGPEPSDDVTET